MGYDAADFNDFEELLDKMGLEIQGFDDTKARPLLTPTGTLAVNTLVARIAKLKMGLTEHTKIRDYAQNNVKKFTELLRAYIEDRGLRIKNDLPEGIKKHQESIKTLRLAKDISYTEEETLPHFLITPDDRVSLIPAAHYIDMMMIENPEIDAMPMIRGYFPRGSPGIAPATLLTGEQVDHINSYINPQWKEYIDDPEIPDELPVEVDKLVNTTIATDHCRLFFWHWLYMSITTRASAYLILCGDPAIGKNRIKALVRALHGHHNSVDGAHDIFKDKFNSQFLDNTLVWCDELKYTEDDNNAMKEIPNGTMSIQLKYKNKTRSTAIHGSIAISNNYPRDNFIEQNDRKKAPLEMVTTRLEERMSTEEISRFSDKVDDPMSPTYDPRYIAQIVKWVIKNGERKDLFPRGEYRGPQFWKLALTSMSRWQKAAVTILMSIHVHSRVGNIDEGKLRKGHFLGSNLRDLMLKSKVYRFRDEKFPDLSTMYQFFRRYRNLNGEKVFEVTESGDTISGDFWIKKLRDDEYFLSKPTPPGEEPENEVADL